MKTIKVTVAEFRTLQGLKSPVEANSIINLLKVQGVAKEVGKKKRTDGRGKPATIYEIPQEVTLKLFKDEDMPKTVESQKTVESEVKASEVETV